MQHVKSFAGVQAIKQQSQLGKLKGLGSCTAIWRRAICSRSTTRKQSMPVRQRCRSLPG